MSTCLTSQTSMKAIQASEVIERVQNVREGKLRVRTELTDVLQALIQGVERGIDPVASRSTSRPMRRQQHKWPLQGGTTFRRARHARRKSSPCLKHSSATSSNETRWLPTSTTSCSARSMRQRTLPSHKSECWKAR